jgi:hypothetical protein
VKLDSVYHWSPTDRRDSIRANGLNPYSPPCVGGIPQDEWANHDARVICFGTCPRSAWNLSGAMDYESLTEFCGWDLWQAELGEHDTVQTRTETGPDIWEVRVFNTIPPDRLWLVGERS